MKPLIDPDKSHVPVTTRISFNSPSHWLLPGLIAGAVYLVIAMVTGAFSKTAWAMLDGIAQTVGINAPAGYGFAPGPLLAGIVVHLVVSIGLGAIFTAIARWRRFRGWVLVVAAVIFASVEPGIAIWGVLHSLLSHPTFFFFLTALPLWASALGHCMYGLTLGLLLAFGPFTLTWAPQQPTVQR
jgi:hypothetical protein